MKVSIDNNKMIHTYIPYAPKETHTNLGMVYNNFMEMIGDDDWACFLDHDATFTTRHWYFQLNEIIEKNPQYGLLTAMTNRIGQKLQVVQGVDTENHDIKYHRAVGKAMQEQHNTNVTDLTTNNSDYFLSGVVILISKKAWKECGGFIEGFLGVDRTLHKNCVENGVSVGRMDGVYVYHWYRGDGDMQHVIEAQQLGNNTVI